MAIKPFPRLLLSLAVLILFSRAGAQTVNLTSSNLPIVVINTNGQEIPDDPKIVADMGIIYNGPGVRNNITDTKNHYSGKIGIEIRGQSSQMFPMKSYSVELRKADGVSSQDKSLFGLPKESDWVMYAPYTDKTLMRNFLAYTMSNSLGHWAAHCMFVEVVINGDYKGIYVFMEKIKRNSGRVNIPKMATTDLTGDASSGGYIFSLDKEPNGWFSSYKPWGATGNGYPQFSYVYPKPTDIQPAQAAYIKSYVDSFELALARPDFQDPVNGVRRFADLTSFMDYFFVNEISRNVDGYRLSSYFYKNRNSIDRRIVAGPVWDYDLAFRNADYCNGSDVRGWAYLFNYTCPGDGAGMVPFWWEKLMQDTAFTAGLRCRWKAMRQTVLSNDRINFLIDSVNTLVSEAQVRHFTRWPVLGQYIWPNPQPIPTSYAGEIEQLKAWIASRLAYIDGNLPNNGACADWPLTAPGSIILSSYPNPVPDQFSVRLLSKDEQPVSIQAVDMQGRTMYSSRETARKGMNTWTVDASAWSRGVYILVARTAGGEKQVLRLVRQ